MQRVILAFLLLVSGLSLSSIHAEVNVSADSAMHYVQILSDPALFEGRKSGTPRGNQSQVWAAEKFRAWGLTPLLDDNLLLPYRQLTCIEKRGKLTLLDSRHGKIDYLLGDDFTVCTNSGSARLTAPVTIVGYGIGKPDKGWDDYKDVDLTGRIAIITRGTPPTGEKWEEEFTRTYLYPEAVRHGAIAVLFYQEGSLINGAAIQQAAYNPSVPAGYISGRVLNHLLQGSGYTADSYRRELKNGPLPLEIARRMTLDFRTEEIPDAFAYNVVGVVPGTDPNLAEEAILIGGHGDHVGPNAKGVIYAGADDNASGAGVVMELARTFSAEPQGRTLIFCLFGGEEQGLLGSEALAPRLPESYRYVAMLNLDMAGRGEGVTGMGGGDQFGEAWENWHDSLPDSLRTRVRGGRAWGGYSSDHAPFREIGIPAFTCYSSGSHDFYHAADDRFSTIQRPAIAGSATSLASWIDFFADWPTPLAGEYLEARTIWHRTTPLKWLDLDAHPAASLQHLADARRAGYLGLVARLPEYRDVESEREIDRLLLELKSMVDSDSRLSLGKAVSAVRSGARSASGTLLPAIGLDSFQPEDTLRLNVWFNMGVAVGTLASLEGWVQDEGLTDRATILCDLIKQNKATLQLPLEIMPSALPLVERLGKQLLFVGPAELLSTLSEVDLQQTAGNGGRILLLANVENCELLLNHQQLIQQHNIHVQPATDDYSESLLWVENAINAGVPKSTLLDWLGGNLGRW